MSMKIVFKRDDDPIVSEIANYFKGDKGDTGDKGDRGYSPVKGVDYYTEAEKEQFAADTIEAVRDTLDEAIEGLDKTFLVIE